MPSFKDVNAREWVVKLDAPTIKDVRSECGIDLVALDGAAFTKMQQDPCQLVDVLWVVCRRHSPDATPQHFAEALLGDAIDRATEALIAAVLDFSPSQKRAVLGTIFKAQTAQQSALLTNLSTKISDGTLLARMLREQELQMNERIESLLTRSSSASNTPVIAESLPPA